MKKGISSRSKEGILTLYIDSTRKTTAKTSYFWHPQFKREVKRLEKVVRRGTRMIWGLENKPYNVTPKEPHLFGLLKKRLRLLLKLPCIDSYTGKRCLLSSMIGSLCPPKQAQEQHSEISPIHSVIMPTILAVTHRL